MEVNQLRMEVRAHPLECSNRAVGVAENFSNMMADMCVILPSTFVRYRTDSKYGIFFSELLDLLGISSRVAGTLPVFSGVQYLESVRYSFRLSAIFTIPCSPRSSFLTWLVLSVKSLGKVFWRNTILLYSHHQIASHQFLYLIPEN